MTDEQLKQLKEYYRKEELNSDQLERLWLQLSAKLPDKQDAVHRYSPSFAMASLLIIVVLGLSFQLVSAAQPSSALYPVRLIADNLGARVTGNYDKVLEKRAEDIIKAAKKQSVVEVKEAAKAYSESLRSVKTASPSSQKKENVRETLRKATQKLKTVTPANSQAKTIIENAIKSTSQTVQEVKGVRGENRGSENSQEHRQDKGGK